MAARLRLDLAALALLAAAALGLLAPALFGGWVLYYRDIAIDFLPQTTYLYSSLAAGRFPIWNPLNAGGYPQLAAMQPPFFYPPQGLFLAAAWGWLDWPTALAWYLALHYALAGGFTYALARRWGLTRPGALAAALAFQLSGYLVSLSNLYTNLPAAALLPAAVLLADRLLARPSPRALGAAALVLALQTSACRPDVTLMTALLLVALACRQRRPAAAARALGLVGAALLLAAAANAATLLPVREFIAHSNRVGGMADIEVLSYSFPPLRLLELLVPGFFGDVEAGTDWGRHFLRGPGDPPIPYLLALYGGVTVYLLALCARSPAGRPGLAPFLWGVWAAATLLALGRWTPVYGWFLHLPGARYVRFPSKFFLLWSFSLALLAGLGVDAARRSRAAGWQAGAAALALGLAGLALLWLGRDPALAWLGAVDYRRLSWHPPADLDATMRFLLPGLHRDALRGGLAACAWATACLLLLRALPGPRAALPLALLAGADLLAHNAGAIFYAAPAIYRPPPLAGVLAPGEGGTPPRLVRPYGNQAINFRRLSLAGELAPPGEPLEPHRYALMLAGLEFNSNLFHGIDNGAVYASLRPRVSLPAQLEAQFPWAGGTLDLGAGDPLLERYARVAGAAGVEFLLVRVAAPPAGRAEELPNFRRSPHLALAWQDGERLFLYRNLHALPRAYFVADALVVSPAEAAPAVAAHARDLSRLAVLTGDQALRDTLPLRARLPKQAPGVPRSCRILRYTPTAVEIANASPASGFLVLADNHYPGWRVSVDGQERPLLLANGFARGVYVEAGQHLVRFHYEPRPFFAGLLISLAALAVLAGLLSRSGR